MKNTEGQQGYLFSKGYSNYVFVLLFYAYVRLYRQINRNIDVYVN